MPGSKAGKTRTAIMIPATVTPDPCHQDMGHDAVNS